MEYYSAESRLAVGVFEFLRKSGYESLDDYLLGYAQYRVYGSCHTDICDIGSAFGEDCLICRLHMGMGTIYTGCLAVEIVAQGDFFAGDLCVKIYQYDIGTVFYTLNFILYCTEWTVDVKQVYSAHSIYYTYLLALTGQYHTACTGCALGIVDRADDVVFVFEELDYVFFAEGVIAQGECIYSCFAQGVIISEGYTITPGHIFCIGYAEVDIVVLFYFTEDQVRIVQTAVSEYVAYYQYVHNVHLSMLNFLENIKSRLKMV